MNELYADGLIRTFIEVPLFSKRWAEIELGDEDNLTKEEKNVLKRLVKSLKTEASANRGKKIMSSLFEDLKTGLQEAINFERGVGNAKSKTLVIAPVQRYSNVEIREIRNRSGMTQTVFANYMGVSKKTVEAWELGRTHPTGPAYRLISILDQGKQDELSFLSVK